MFYIQYVWAEVRRRWGRTALTAFGLAVGVGLVVIVGALSQGLDDAQDEVLEPLTGVGTDLSVSRPLVVQGDEATAAAGAGDPFTQLSNEEQGTRVRTASASATRPCRQVRARSSRWSASPVRPSGLRPPRPTSSWGGSRRSRIARASQ